MSPKKIELEKTEIEFLGLNLSADGLKLQDHIIVKIKEFSEEIKDQKQLQQFLGIVNYGRNFFPNLSEKIGNLYEKLKKDKTFSWSKENSKIIKNIKSEINYTPKVSLPKQGDRLILETDASQNYWGCILKAKTVKNRRTNMLI